MKNIDKLIDNILINRKITKNIASKIKKILIQEIDLHCCFCNKKFKKSSDITFEHIIPKCKPGIDKNNIDNLTFSCVSCNTNRDVADFESYRSFVRTKDIPPEGSRDRIKSIKLKNGMFYKDEILALHKSGVEINDICCKLKIKKYVIEKIISEE